MPILVAAGCGQMTGIHGQAPAITTIAGVGVTTGLQPGTGLADSGATGDIGAAPGRRALSRSPASSSSTSWMPVMWSTPRSTGTLESSTASAVGSLGW